MTNGASLLLSIAAALLIAFCTKALVTARFAANGMSFEPKRAPQEEGATKARFLNSMSRLGELFGASSSDTGKIQEKLLRADLRITPGTWIGIQVAAATTGTLLGIVMLLQSLDSAHILLGSVIVAGGIFGPNLILASLTRDRQRKIASSMASTLELLSITVRSGYPLERGLRLVATTTSGPLAKEFKQVDTDMNLLGMSLERALSRMSDRCRIPEVASFSSALIQASQQGTSVSRVLDSQARLARNAHYANLQERVNKLPAKLVVPIFGIMMLIIVIALVPPIYDAVVLFASSGGLSATASPKSTSIFG